MLAGEYPVHPATPLTSRLAGALILLAGSADRYWAQFREGLRCDGAEFVSVGSGRGALELLRRTAFDLVVLGERLPDVSGITFLVEARRLGNVPVIVMASHGADSRVHSFDLGADDVVAPTIEPEEFARRVETLLRRTRPVDGASQTLKSHGVTMNRAAHEVLVHGTPLPLTVTEFAILSLLLDRRGEVLSADAIARAVWHYETFGSPNFVQAQVSRLRSKLKQAGVDTLIATIRGAGYVIR